jgi:NAD(P)-dependent dehydrogenase (short-subunit alcohol dehydrogenase family)
MRAMDDGTRVALITGATGPLGRAAAAAFAADGVALGLVGTDPVRLESMVRDLDLAPDACIPAVADLRDAAAARSAVAAVVDRFGRIDILLHLVGGWTGGTALVDLDAEVLRGMLDQHVWSTFHVAQAVVPGMVEHGWGRVIGVTSTTTTAPGPKVGAYVAAKAGEEAMLRVLAREVAGGGVTVNTIAVSTIDAGHEREHEPSKTNAGWTTPEEIVATMRFLCSDAAAAVTGVRIPLDGRR